MVRAIRFSLPVFMFFVFALLTLRADNSRKPTKPTKPTELVIWKYETLIMDGALLSPDGWKKVALLFSGSVSYPSNSIINIIWTPRLIAEDWIKGNRAQVESKWVDYYGSIDANLKYHPPEVCDLSLLRLYDLESTNTPDDTDTRAAMKETKNVEWKLVWQNERAATIEQVIDYLIQKREAVNDPAIKRNATSSVASLQNLLKKLKRGRGASAC